MNLKNVVLFILGIGCIALACFFFKESWNYKHTDYYRERKGTKRYAMWGVSSALVGIAFCWGAVSKEKKVNDEGIN